MTALQPSTRQRPARTPRARILPLIVVGRLLWRCAFSVFAVLAGTIVLTAVPQAREALTVFADDAQVPQLHAIFFVVAVLYWAISAWFSAWLLLGWAFDPDSLGVSRNDPFVDWLATVLPRALALVATVPMAVLVWQVRPVLGAVLLLASAAFIVGLVLRRRFGSVDSHRHRSYAEFATLGIAGHQGFLGLIAFGVSLFGSFWSLGLGMALAAAWAVGAVALLVWDLRRSDAPERAPWTDWTVFGLDLGAALAMLLLGWLRLDQGEIDLARRIGSPSILLCALAGWTLFGGLILTFLPLARRFYSLAWVLPPLLFLLGSLHETHWVAQRPMAPSRGAPAADAAWRAHRPTVQARFAQWMSQHRAGDPVYLVAVAGGASRAGFWSGSVLARLEDEAHARQRRFAANVFALSSISGGSLGAAAWVAELAEHPEVMPCTAAAPADCRRRRVEDFLGRDFLSPVVARMLGPDFATRFVPLPVSDRWSARADRSLGLEQAWAQDWPAAMARPSARVDWNRPLTELYTHAESGHGPRLPTLMLNTVRIDDGQRFLQSNVKADLRGVQDLLDDELDTGRLTLAQAVHNSARFPYVSPAAAVRAASAPDAVVGRLGDGGYHESSGAATLADLIELLRASGQLHEPVAGQGLWACGSGWSTAARDGASGRAESATCATPVGPVVAVVLDSGPAVYPQHHLRDLEGRPLPPVVDDTAPRMMLPELLGPVFGGLSTRSNLQRDSQARLSSLVGDQPRAFIELRMPFWRPTRDDAFLSADERQAGVCDGHDRQPSMNWALDRCSQARLRAATAPESRFEPHPALAQRALVNQLARLRSWIDASSPDPGGARSP